MESEMRDWQSGEGAEEERTFLPPSSKAVIVATECVVPSNQSNIYIIITTTSFELIAGHRPPLPN